MKRHPRTLLEAFGVDARSACAIERPAPTPLLERVLDVALATVIGLALALLLVHGLSS